MTKGGFIDVGDVVVLKSGGPDMVVTTTGFYNGEVYVKWIGDNGDVQSAMFPPVCLKKVHKRL